jgi:hypothetical protein
MSITGTWQTLAEELKTRPLTLLVLLGLCGYVYWSYTNHASANDLHEVNEQVDSISEKIDRLLILNIRSAIQQRRIEYCNTSDDALRSILRDSINDLAEQYRDITGDAYQVQSCRDLLARAGRQ